MPTSAVVSRSTDSSCTPRVPDAAASTIDLPSLRATRSRIRRSFIQPTSFHSPVWPLPDSSRIAGTDSYRGDPLDQRLALRALMSSLIDWVTLKKEPPAPVYPTLAQGDLVRAAELQFPRIPNLPVARIPNQPYR